MFKNILKGIFGSSEEVKGDNDEKPNGLDNSEFYKVCVDITKEHHLLARAQNGYSVALSKLESYQSFKKYSKNKKKEIAYWATSYVSSNWKAVGKIRYQQDQNLSSQIQRNTFSTINTSLIPNLFKSDLGFQEDDFIYFIGFFRKKRFASYGSFYSWPFAHLIIQLERYSKKNEGSEGLKKCLKNVLTWKEIANLENTYHKDELKKIKSRIETILGLSEGVKIDEKLFDFDANDRLYAISKEVLNEQQKEDKIKLSKILERCSKVTGGKPTKKYLSDTSNLIDDLGQSTFKQYSKSLITAVNALEIITEQKSHKYNSGEVYNYIVYEFLQKENLNTLKGLVWSLSKFHEKELIELVYKLASKSFHKIAGHGAIAVALGNACIYYLANSKGKEGVAYLTLLKQQIKQTSTRKLIEKNIEILADKIGMSTSDVEESIVSDFGLTLGTKTIAFNEFSFKLTIEKIGKVKSEWLKDDGKIQKTTPAFVKNSKKLSDKLTKVKKEIKEIQKFLTAQRNRIDNLLIEEKKIPFDNFQKYYFNQGLVSFIARKLIWIIEDKNKSSVAFFKEEKWIDYKGKEIEAFGDDATFQLWHPIYAEVEEVIGWRNFLMDNEIVQPLKQAYREIYIVTEAEINTKSYSNRMAAHLIKQHQFNSLAKIRDWEYQLLGGWDHGLNCIAHKFLKHSGITAQFWLNELLDTDQMNDAGIWLYISTDQIRFEKAGEVMDMVDVPKVIFSEIMRDTDLFVGVCSVGNDPQWQDNGGLAQYRDYWTSYSFGDLTEVAKTRKSILENIVPRLKIKDIAKIDGKFLVVKGKIRTYKIHIGSTNILMEPNDQYLCIVPGRKVEAPKNVFLPFEGDRGLSIILSKAFLLAEDHKITDTTITRQIK